MFSDKGADKQQQIRQAAINVFSHKGFHESKMEDVAQEAGVGKGTVYLYFPSKQALLEDIFRYVIDLYVEAVDAMATGERPLRECLQGIVVHAVTMGDGNQQAAHFFLEGATGTSEEFKAWVIRVKRLILDRFVQVIEAAALRNEIRQVDAEVWAHLIVGGIDSLVATVLWGDGRLNNLPRTQLAALVVEQWWSGLDPQEEG